MTVADRYYSLASVNPMAAFPRVDDLGQKHLRKLRRDNIPGLRAVGVTLKHLLKRRPMIAAKPLASSVDNVLWNPFRRDQIGLHYTPISMVRGLTGKRCLAGSVANGMAAVWYG
jgi:CRISPR-associated protein (Cas_Csd1)